MARKIEIVEPSLTGVHFHVMDYIADVDSRSTHYGRTGMTVPRGLFPVQSEVILASLAIRLEPVPCGLALLGDALSRATKLRPPSGSPWVDVARSAPTTAKFSRATRSRTAINGL
jgi:hypothetical protein